MVYGEFSTLNLVEVKHIRERHHVILMVKRNLTFVSAKFCAYSFIFGTTNFAKQFYQTIIRHVHRQQVVERPPPTNAVTQNAPEVVINAEIIIEELNGEAESVVVHDKNDTNVSSLENFNVSNSDQEE
uniref:Uncharacterized protein n=1 Tax=Panagrolaimus superbus TaxID=310955 RepID=A0A914XXQ5_9BILA